MWEKVVVNLLANAVKYTDRGAARAWAMRACTADRTRISRGSAAVRS
jgi:hypothetical protein